MADLDLTVPLDRWPDVPVGLRCFHGPLPYLIVSDAIDRGDDDLWYRVAAEWNEVIGEAPASALTVDLSAPDTGDTGRPLWVDPLDAALREVEHRIGATAHVARNPWSVRRRGALVWVGHGPPVAVHGPDCDASTLRDDLGEWCRTVLVDGWPDFAGLDDDTALRAVVAAVLRDVAP